MNVRPPRARDNTWCPRQMPNRGAAPPSSAVPMLVFDLRHGSDVPLEPPPRREHAHFLLRGAPLGPPPRCTQAHVRPAESRRGHCLAKPSPHRSAEVAVGEAFDRRAGGRGAKEHKTCRACVGDRKGLMKCGVCGGSVKQRDTYIYIYIYIYGERERRAR